MIRASLARIEFLGRTTVELDPNSILVILGPNNSGKSSSLNAIQELISSNPGGASPVSRVSIRRESTDLEVIAELEHYRTQDGNFSVNGHGFADSYVRNQWQQPESLGQALATVILSNLTTRARLGDCDPQKALDLRNHGTVLHPFHRMYRDRSLENSVSELVRRAFKIDLVVHRMAGSSIPVYVGERPTLEPDEERTDLTYTKRIEQLENLEKQGDGIRSFVSVVARVLTENRPIQLIDEPEAFLHPPQAKLVAECVAGFDGGRQTIIATHSSDILQGLLSNHSSRVAVVRLSQSNGTRNAQVLPPDQVKELWRDPILRFSNIFDGLFHDGVVLTEGDADCRFYEALVNITVGPESRRDLQYTYSGGKDRLPVIIRALTAVGVPVATIVDFDVLNNEQPLRQIVEATGGTWGLIEPDWRAVKNAVESKSMFLGSDDFTAAVKAQLEQCPKGEVVPKRVLTDVKKLARRASPWDQAKDAGMRAIPSGASTITAKRLLQSLKDLGIFVAPNGEMEGFYRSVGAHGRRWVEEVLQLDIRKDPELADARAFVTEIASHLAKKPGTACANPNPA